MGRSWRHFDLLLLLAPLALTLFGLAMIYSSTGGTIPSDAAILALPTVRQAIYAFLGFLLLPALVLLDYRLLGLAAPFLYAAGIGLLGLVLFIGEVLHGSRRWIELPLLVIQPSEIAKLVLIIALAKYLSDQGERIRRPSVLLTSLAIAAAPALLVFLQPNMGTTLVFGAIWLGMVLMAGARLRHLAPVAMAVGGTIFALRRALLPPYVLQRLAASLNPASDPLGTGYNILQSEISIGSGGLWGKGFAQGTQSQLHFLRVQSTDFIFSVIGEELGFVGAVLLFGLFLLLLLRGVRAAAMAREGFGQMLASGIVILVLTQAFVNIGVNVRLLPVTGIPLPFVSAGGSSLLTMLLSIGILESIVVRHKKLTF